MTTFPKHPAQKAPAAIADHGRQVTRAHARLDQVESTSSKQSADISTANTNIATANGNITTAQNGVNTNTTGIAAINTRLGSANMAFLATLGQMSHYNPTANGGWTSGGAIVGSTQIDTGVLTTWMNAVVADIAAIQSRLQAENYEA